jgi:hypothetical protein
MATGDSVISEYHRRAEECRLQAEKAKSEDDKARWQQLAERWEYIAADAEQRRKDRSTEKPPSGSNLTLVPPAHGSDAKNVGLPSQLGLPRPADQTWNSHVILVST